MVKKIEGYQAHDGKIFLSEEAAVRHESLERLCQLIPEFQMIRPRLAEQLDAVATAMGPMLDFRRRVPSPGPIVDPLAENPAEVLRGVAQQIADECGLRVDHAAFDRAADHMEQPVAVKLAHG